MPDKQGPRPYGRTIVGLQALLVLAVVAWVLDLPRGWFGVALYTEQFLVTVVGLSLGLAFLTSPVHPRFAGRVPWWGEGGHPVTLGQILVHVVQELARHAGQADILREQVDGAVGYDSPGDNVPEIDLSSYVAKLTALAERF